MKPEPKTRSIQVRLFILLLRGFTATVLLTLLTVFGVTALYLASPAQTGMIDRIPIVTRLETFYLVNESWAGIDQLASALPASEADSLWTRSILVDASNRIVIYHGDLSSTRVGQLYQLAPVDTRMPIIVRDLVVGWLIIPSSFMFPQGRAALTLLAPVFLISIFLALLTIIIGLLLLRRVVMPLSEVIAAARALSLGDLSTRVQVTGPDDLRALSDSFNHMAGSLEGMVNERRNMLADIAHELRTPLTVIRGRLEGIIDGIYSADSSHVAPVLEETYLLERLVEDLRLLTLAETRQLPIERRAVDLNVLAARVIDLFQAEADEKGIALGLASEAEQAWASLDPQRTGQVLSNLVSNALRYTPGGGRVQVLVSQDPGRVSLMVSDNGPGVPPEDIPHLFDRFWRGEKSRSRASGGAGLGLAIARQLVEAQDGTISANNCPGCGMEIRLEFQTIPPA
jgi:signal transduction histidine kinase